MFTVPLGPGLRLRLLEARHAEALYELIDANRAHLERWFPWAPSTRGPDDVRGFIQGSLAKFASGDGFDGLIEADGTPVGSMGLHDLHRRESRTEIGYWLTEARQGEGLATRALAGLLPYVFGELDLQRVEIRCDPDNDRSRAVPERLGFTKEGTLRRVAEHHGRRYDHVVYGLLREEWHDRTADRRAGESDR
ncbi:MAG: GNAT family protein [Trueperaceae bacterium]